jgi:serine/threonine protein kinase
LKIQQLKRIYADFENNKKVKCYKNILDYEEIIYFSDNILGLVMRYIDGENLEVVLKSELLLWNEKCFIIKEIAKGIKNLHDNGILNYKIRNLP